MDGYASEGTGPTKDIDGTGSTEDATSPTGVLEQDPVLAELTEEHGPVTIDPAQHPVQRLLVSA